MLPKLPINNLDWIRYTFKYKKKSLIKEYNEESEKGYFPEIDVQYLEKLHAI